MSKAPKRLSDPPQSKETTIPEILQYLSELVRDLSDAQKKNISGPFNTVAFVPTNYTHTKTLNAGTASATDVADVLCTLIQTLKDGGLIK